MYVVYGSLTHAANTVNLVNHTKRRLPNARGFAERIRETVTVEGFVTGSTQAAIDTAIRSVEAAYAVDGGNFALYRDDGTATTHSLDSGSAIGGVRVVDFSFPESDGSQFATQRTFRATLEADYAAGGDNQIASFQETLRIVGTGGPRTVHLPTLSGRPKKQTVAQRTVVRATQSGRAVGFLGPISAPAPLFASALLHDRTEVSQGSPRNDRGVFVDWPTSWSYQFESAGPLSGRPHRR